MKRRRPHSNRGRHKRARSPETLRFEALNHAPACPGWLDSQTYSALLRLRQRMQLDDGQTAS